MRKNTTISTLIKISFLLVLFTASMLSFAQPCAPKWNRAKSSNCENSPIQFEANSPGKNTWEWDYGDGFSSGSGTAVRFRDPVHSYSKAGLYVVTYKFSVGTTVCSDTIMILIKESPRVKTRAITPLSQCFKGNKFCFIELIKVS